MNSVGYNRPAFSAMRHLRHIRRPIVRALPIAFAIVAAALCGGLAIAPAGAQTPIPPTRTPAPTPIAPLARIVTPVRGQTLGDSVTVQGSALLQGFARYEIAYASEPDLKTWTVLGGGTQMVDNGALSTWNTRALAPGEYALRLQVFGADGKSTDVLVRNLVVAAQATSAPPAAAATVAPAARATVTTPAAAAATPSIADAFLKGVRVTALAFGGLAAYLLLKKLAFALWRRVRGESRIDYGA